MKHEYVDRADVLDLALTALRSMQEARETLSLEQLREVPHGKIKDGTLQNIANRVNEIASPPAHIDRSEWISVKERLPEIPGEYLVAYHPCHWDNVYPGIRVGTDLFRGRTTWAKKKYQRITHWMPLPEPPEEESE